MTSQRPASTNKLWVVAAVLAASVCVCGGFALASSGVLLVALAPWRSAASAPIVTPTTRPVSLGDWQALPDLPRTINVFSCRPNDPQPGLRRHRPVRGERQRVVPQRGRRRHLGARSRWAALMNP